MDKPEEVAVTFSVETAVHDSLRKMAQRTWDDYGLSIRSVTFSWIEAPSIEKSHMFVTDVLVASLSKQDLKPPRGSSDG